MGDNEPDRPLIWMASSKRDLMDMPPDVIKNFGFGLYQAQIGKHPDIGKVLRGFGRASVVELIQDTPAGTFRAMYTVQFAEFVVVLHVFQKKSKKGIETPKKEMDLVRSRLQLAVEMHQGWKNNKDTV